MDVLQKLQNEVKRLDCRVTMSVGSVSGYDEASAHYRDLLEAAIKEIAHIRLHRDLALSVVPPFTVPADFKWDSELGPAGYAVFG